jgi:hypothetical protein
MRLAGTALPHCASARLESNQRSSVPETGGVAVSPTGRHTPGGNRTRAFPVEGRASSPLDHGGLKKSEALDSNQTLLGISEPCRHGHRPPTEAPAAGIEPAPRE